jgi:2',3'-cyclic-nucleotide 2'-phosphodiesterase (5'-nucleotidase family)
VQPRVQLLDLVETAKKCVPTILAQGVYVMVVSAHAGDSGVSSYTGDIPVENASAMVAQQVPGIDAILFGHAHNDVSERFVTEITGETVVMSEPKCWGERLSVFDLTLTRDRGRWKVTDKSATTVNTNTVEEDPKLVALVKKQHDAVVAYVNQDVATSTEAMSVAESCWKDSAILDYVHLVQTAKVKEAATAGTAYASLPVLSIAAPFSRTAIFPAGRVTIKDIAGLYVYDNTLLGSILTGSQIKAYLEYSAQYFKRVAADAPVDPGSWTNANNRPDYNYDQFSGITYDIDIDIAQAEGSRILNLAYNGTALTDDQQFIVAVNNYRQSGGGGFPHISAAPVVYNAQVAIREAIVAYASAAKTIDPSTFHVENWKLVRDGVSVF